LESVLVALTDTPDVILHSLSTREITAKMPKAHKGKISGLCYASAERLLSCGVDRTVKLWSTEPENDQYSSVSDDGTHSPHCIAHLSILSIKPTLILI
jgi:WD40 repeat protein